MDRLSYFGRLWLVQTVIFLFLGFINPLFVFAAIPSAAAVGFDLDTQRTKKELLVNSPDTTDPELEQLRSEALQELNRNDTWLGIDTAAGFYAPLPNMSHLDQNLSAVERDIWRQREYERHTAMLEFRRERQRRYDAAAQAYKDSLPKLPILGNMGENFHGQSANLQMDKLTTTINLLADALDHLEATKKKKKGTEDCGPS